MPCCDTLLNEIGECDVVVRAVEPGRFYMRECWVTLLHILFLEHKMAATGSAGGYPPFRLGESRFDQVLSLMMYSHPLCILDALALEIINSQ